MLMSDELITRARQLSGLSQDELARRSGTSRPTLSAYEHGRKSPSLATATRILTAAGCELEVIPRVKFSEILTPRNHVIMVPDRLWRLPLEQAFARVTLPLQLSWSTPGREYLMRNRRRRARVYEIVLREGSEHDLLTYMDGALLIDLWEELVVPSDIRRAWQPAIDGASGSPLSTQSHLAS
jgi:transcriptional regulator with XRE-family HTH domain